MAPNIIRKFLYESPSSSDPDLPDFCSKLCDPSDDDAHCSSPSPSSCDSCPPICYSLYPPPTNPKPNKPPKLSPPFTISLSILSLAFLLLSCYSLYKYCQYRRRSRSRSSSRRRSSRRSTEETHDDFLDQDQGPAMVDHPIWYIRTVGLHQSLIDSITVFDYRKGDGIVDGTECSVCLTEFGEDDPLRLLPKCNHAFHLPCIDTWLRSHTNCPLCRAPIFPPAAAAAGPSPEPIVDQVRVSEEIGELGQERGEEGVELGIGAEEEEGGIEIGDKESGDEVQPLRRSVSVDSLAASMISLAIANDLGAKSDGILNSDTQLGEIVPKRLDVNQSFIRLVGSSSIGRSLQRGPSSIRRSLSCSGKVLLSRYTKSQNSVLPP